ncbi:hypothetical protein WSM22_38760 [Cytophagales bacterium WSM2-2]|nr:hypothetical protein WSM22_38760 [Cytophagales bacterium WSM2-2]
MNFDHQEMTSEYILEQWRLRKSSLDWRPLSENEKNEWLDACLAWRGLPDQQIKAFNYIVDGSQVNSRLGFYCLLGESFFGYRGYFGRDSHGFNDCFSEIALFEKTKSLVEEGAKVTFKNSKQIREVLDSEFESILQALQRAGFKIKIE